MTSTFIAHTYIRVFTRTYMFMLYADAENELSCIKITEPYIQPIPSEQNYIENNKYDKMSSMVENSLD